MLDWRVTEGIIDFVQGGLNNEFTMESVFLLVFS